MFESRQSPEYGSSSIDLAMDCDDPRGRKKETVTMTRSRSRRWTARKRGRATTVVGFAHRRQRKCSW